MTNKITKSSEIENIYKTLESGLQENQSIKKYSLPNARQWLGARFFALWVIPIYIIKKLNNLSKEKSFILPLPWDINGQRNLVRENLHRLNLTMKSETIDLIVESIGNDSSLINTELQKLKLLSESTDRRLNKNEPQEVTKELVKKITQNTSTNSLEIANLLIKKEKIAALNKIHSLLKNGEPALRLITTLTGQARGWLWVHLLDKKGNQDIKEIAKLAGIANPKRIFVIHKQIQGKSIETLLELMKKLLKIEAEIKSGTNPVDSFKDNLLTDSKILTNS